MSKIHRFYPRFMQKRAQMFRWQRSGPDYTAVVNEAVRAGIQPMRQIVEELFSEHASFGEHPESVARQLARACSNPSWVSTQLYQRSREWRALIKGMPEQYIAQAASMVGRDAASILPALASGMRKNADIPVAESEPPDGMYENNVHMSLEDEVPAGEMVDEVIQPGMTVMGASREDTFENPTGVPTRENIDPSDNAFEDGDMVISAAYEAIPTVETHHRQDNVGDALDNPGQEVSMDEAIGYSKAAAAMPARLRWMVCGFRR